MTHVLVTTDAVGGVWTHTLELVDALAADGVAASVAILGPPPSNEQRRALDASAAADVAEHNGALEWMPDPWDDVADAGRWLVDLKRRWRPDVVHLGGFSHAAQEWAVPVVVVAHSDVVTWWRAVHGTDPCRTAWDRYIDCVRAGLHAADAVVAPTAAALGATQRAYGGSGGVVVPNGRRADWVVETDKEPLILAAGRMWDEAKNLTALRAVAADCPWPVAIAGTPEVTDDPVIELGPLPFAELATWLGRAAIFAAPARYEPFGMAALEAGLSGCALVLGDIASLREVWGSAARYVAPDDHDALSGALHELAADHAGCVAAGAAARAVAATFTPARMAAGYRRVYASIGTDRSLRWTS
jgi:glycogen synthase